MGVTNFDTINGQIIAETTSGVTKNYVVDALGSVTGVSQNGSISGAARYSPYGRTIAGTSGAVGGWVWSWGYYPTGRAFASHYVRARVFDNTTGTWTTTDRQWPRQQQYLYVHGSPCSDPDPSGLNPRCHVTSFYPHAGPKECWVRRTAAREYDVYAYHVMFFECTIKCPVDAPPCGPPYCQSPQWADIWQFKAWKGDIDGVSITTPPWASDGSQRCAGPNLIDYRQCLWQMRGIDYPGWWYRKDPVNSCKVPREQPNLTSYHMRFISFARMDYAFWTCCGLPPNESGGCSSPSFRWSVHLLINASDAPPGGGWGKCSID